MIDFQNCVFTALSKEPIENFQEELNPILVENETIISTYRDIRDFVAFTNKRIIAVNKKGLTGKKSDYTSIPYSKITTFSFETAGLIDLDAELEVYISAVGRVKFEFLKGFSDVIEIGKIISGYIL